MYQVDQTNHKHRRFHQDHHHDHHWAFGGARTEEEGISFQLSNINSHQPPQINKEPYEDEVNDDHDDDDDYEDYNFDEDYFRMS